jgi:hypothetical protein
VLEGLGLDLGQGVRIDFVACRYLGEGCLREGGRDEEEGRDRRGNLSKAELMHGDLTFSGS